MQNFRMRSLHFNNLMTNICMRHESGSRSYYKNPITMFDTFNNGFNAHTRIMVGASANGSLLSKSYNEAYEILERISSNNYQCLTQTTIRRRVTEVHEPCFQELPVKSRVNLLHGESELEWSVVEFVQSFMVKPSEFFMEQSMVQKPPPIGLLTSLENLLKEYMTKNDSLSQGQATLIQDQQQH
ncbi:hypothetical protein EPI10_003911 [Gossypium australe]|uniref:Uncharacterized protein n=1 Tax=Gossypium australe TaxID=47621 RepID=A0A5B6UGU3_9ROSI|nr:hypothetical protein EPI10_003911 [Gossypium australe]